MIVRRRNKDSGEIPTASMADIAFLLLVFFLVTTTINQDKGLGLVLPDWGNQMDVPKKNIMNILINASGEIMVDNEVTALAFVREKVEKRMAENDKLIVSLKPDKSTEYERYVEVLDQVMLSGTKRISIADPDQ